MKMRGRRIRAVAIALLACVFMGTEGEVFATPSTTYWTPATSDVQPFNVWHIGVDNYFRLYQSAAEQGSPGALPTDVGLTVGVLPYEKLNMETGIDYLGPARLAHSALQS